MLCLQLALALAGSLLMFSFWAFSDLSSYFCLYDVINTDKSDGQS